MKLHIKYKREYSSWASMKERCNNTNHKFYNNYGGKGITYAPEWEKFENFLEDMGSRPINKSLDKIDNSKNYSKDNCRWATRQEQSQNRDYCITFNGECSAQASIRLGGSKDMILMRLKRGWDKKRAFTEPKIRRGV